MNTAATRRRKLNKHLIGETGSAMVVTLLVMSVLTGLGAVVFGIGINNLQNTGRDRLAGGALGASEGGVAQALAFIRSDGLSTLKCDDPPVAGTNCNLLWGKNNPKVISLANGRQYSVWIQRIDGFKPPAVKIGTYLVHSTGTAGAGPGKRLVDVTLKVKPLNYPIGLYADNVVGAGTPDVHKESVFTQNCLTGREKLVFDGTDPWNNIPAAAHSTQYISEKVNSGCSSSESNNIHTSPAPGVCNTAYPNDQDALGGSLAGQPCQGAAGAYPQTSFFDLNALKTYGYSQPKGLSPSEYAALKAKAQEQGTYFTTTTVPTPANPPPYLNAVYYWDLGVTGGTVTIQTELNAFGVSHCGSRSIVLVVRNGDMHVNSGAEMNAAIFIPEGNYQGNGHADIIGTLFAKTIDKVNGTADFTLVPDPPADPNCWFDNMPGGLIDVTVDHFREVDR